VREVAEAALRSADIDPVLSLLETHKHTQADAKQHLERARTLWNDFCARRSTRVRVPKPATYAAAIEYTLSKLAGGTGVTQAELARRYNVTTRAIASRHEEIRATLELEPGDPRYSAL
jgi:transcription initiation factor TFIIIB Brf1 subunit/transcription initiation factor TFIIB